MSYRVLEAEGDQSFATSKCAFWNINFKLVVRKQKTPKEPLTLFLLASGNSEAKTCCRKGISAVHLSLSELSVADREDPSKHQFTTFPSVSHCFWVVQQELVYHRLSFCELPASLCNPRFQTPFFFAQNGI